MDLISPEPKVQPTEVERSFVLGVDLGKTHDFTALALVQRIKDGTGRWEIDGDKVRREVSRVHFECNRIKRLTQGIDWPLIIGEVAASFANVRRLDPRAALVVDNNGLGGPIVDQFRAAGLRPIAVTTHGGMETREASHDDLRVPKLELIRRLEAGLKSGELKLAKGDPDLAILRQEVTEFRLYYTAAGNLSGEHPATGHDDMFFALALAFWYASRPRSEARVVRVIGC